jgi:hypothetical protein
MWSRRSPPAVEDRLGGATPRLITGDEYSAYEAAIEAAFAVPEASAPATSRGVSRSCPRAGSRKG